MEVVVWLCLSLLLGLCRLGLVPNYVVLALGDEGGVLITCKIAIHVAYGLV
jgi:hypothetical protein